jgi:hypothetical protein
MIDPSFGVFGRNGLERVERLAGRASTSITAGCNVPALAIRRTGSTVAVSYSGERPT